MAEHVYAVQKTVENAIIKSLVDQMIDTAAKRTLLPLCATDKCIYSSSVRSKKELHKFKTYIAAYNTHMHK